MKYKAFIGVDIGGTNIKSALIINGKINKRIKLPTKANLGVTQSVRQIKSAIEPFIKNTLAVGIGIAGIVDSRNGLVRFSPNLKGWHNIRLASILKNEFKKPVKILNDANAICLGEWKYGAARGYKNIFLFTLGTGVGGAAVSEGKLVLGANSFAGELGHTVIKYDGPKCRCGNYGCLERYVGARYIINLAKEKIKKKKSSLNNYKKLTPEIIAREAKKGDTIAREVFSEIGYYIGVGVTNVIALFDPDIVVMSGGISRAGRPLFEPIKKTVFQRVLGAQYRNYKIVPAQLGDDAGVLGAGSFASGTIMI